MARRLLVLMVCCFLTAPVFAVSGDLSFQGVVKVKNRPFHGTGQFKFALFTDGGVRVWANDGTVGLNEPGAPVALAVEAGLFSVSLGSASGMAAIDPALFRQSLSLRVWFSPDGLSYERLLPDRALTTAPYSAVSAIAETADLASLALESLDARTLEGHPAEDFAPADGRGFTSGLPAITDPHFPGPLYYLRASIDGQFSGRLAGSVGAAIEVRESYARDPRFPEYQPGPVTFGTLTLWQVPGTPVDWYSLFESSLDGVPVSHLVELVLNHADGSEVCRWRFTGAVPIGYHQVAKPTGLIVDEITFSVGGFSREAASGIVPAGEPGLGLSVVQSYRNLVIRGVEYTNYWVAESVGASVDISRTPKGEPVLGRIHTQTLLVRQNPTAEQALYQLFAAALRGEDPQERIDLVLRDDRGDEISRYRHVLAWPYSYRLLLADDNQPVEEFRFIADRVIRP